MNKFAVLVPKGRMSLVAMRSFLFLLSKPHTKVFLLVENCKEGIDKQMLENLKRLCAHFIDYYDANVQIIQNCQNTDIVVFDDASTRTCFDFCPEQIIHEVIQLSQTVQEKGQWTKSEEISENDEIWQYIVCPEFQVESKSEYGFQYQCGDCLICHKIVKQHEQY